MMSTIRVDLELPSVLKLDGHLTHTTCLSAAYQLTRFIELEGPVVTLDCSNLKSLDSGGLGVLTDLYLALLGERKSLHLHNLHGQPLNMVQSLGITLFSQDHYTPKSVRVTKRIIDILGSIFILVIFFPILVLVAVLIKLDSPGKIIYKQERVKQWHTGSFYKRPDLSDLETFTIYKFRTMVENAELECGAINACSDDPRITRIGALLRKTRIDEIPNFINVLLGDMSIVGPRADRAEIFHQVEDDFPYVWERSKYVKPGITGDAQLYLRSDGTLTPNSLVSKVIPESDQGKPVNSFRYKLYFDYAYMIKLSSFQSFLYTDLKTMFLTPYVMFIRKTSI